MTVRTIVSAPLGVVGDYPSHLAELGQGGFEVVADIATRDAIVDERKKDKMVFVKANDAGDPAMYYWDGAAWQVVDQSAPSEPLIIDGNPVHELVMGGNLVAEQDSVTDTKYNIHVAHGAFEPMHKPSYLAYIKGQKFIAKDSEPRTEDVQNASKIAFEDTVYGGMSPYIGTDVNKETFSIEEADTLDPNITGGTDYLISFRVSMKGVAPSNGTVSLYLYDASINPFDKDTYLQDVHGNPLVVAKQFNKGDALNVMDITGIVNAKGEKSFTCHVVTDFTESIELNDRFYGGTGLVIQAISPTEKTGDGMIQFEMDTDNRIWFEHDETDGYKLKESQNYKETYGRYDEKWGRFVQNTQGNLSLRYTVNNTEIPMPCGVPFKSGADITVDNTVNQIAGSQASGGEGALKFGKDGEAKISTSVRLDNETDHGSTVWFWWSLVDADGNMTKIDASERQFLVTAGQKNMEVVLPTFTLPVVTGDRIALRAKSDYVDGVYLQTNSDRYPLVETTIDFKEIVQGN